MADASFEGDAAPPGFTALVSGYQDPYALYDRARCEGGISFDPLSGCWLVTAHGVAREILRDSRFSSELKTDNAGASSGRAKPFVQRAIEKQILFSDGEEHLRVQKVILHETTRRAKALSRALRDSAERIARDLAVRREFDLVTDFALPYSMETICSVMGIELESQGQLRALADWSSTFGALTSGYLFVRQQHIVQLGEYFRELVAERKRSPADDLIGNLIEQDVFEDEEDLIINCMVIFAAGRITTQKLLGNGIPFLLPTWASWRERIRGNASECRRLTDELLRLVTPTRYLARRALEDVEILLVQRSGVRIRAGEKVILFLEAANRDPDTFPHSEILEVERSPNPHLAFGDGAHRCPGAGVARLEIQVALSVLLEVLADLRQDPARAPTWDPNPNLGGYESFPSVCP